MRSKIFTILITVTILVSSSLISCGKQLNFSINVADITTTLQETTTAKTTTTIEATTTTEIATTTIINETNDYKDKMDALVLKLSESTYALIQSMGYYSNGEISMSQCKKDTSNFIEDVNNCYNIYLSINAPKKFETHYELFGKCIEHLINCTVYSQQFIDAENTSDIVDYLKKGQSELKIASEYIQKSIEQFELIN